MLSATEKCRRNLCLILDLTKPKLLDRGSRTTPSLKVQKLTKTPVLSRKKQCIEGFKIAGCQNFHNYDMIPTSRKCFVLHVKIMRRITLTTLHSRMEA